MHRDEWGAAGAQSPIAIARITGGRQHPGIGGSVKFYRMKRGATVVAEIWGLPDTRRVRHPVFGFHIHGGASCTGNSDDPFADAGTHYNPEGREHPYHAGDLPPLFATRGGYAYLSVYTDRFDVGSIIGKTVIIHDSPDDFTTQPGGNSGRKIACGVIERVRVG